MVAKNYCAAIGNSYDGCLTKEFRKQVVLQIRNTTGFAICSMRTNIKSIRKKYHYKIC